MDVTRFLAYVRGRLWFNQWLDGARISVWSASLLLVMLAAVHTWLVPVPAWLLMLAPLSVAVLAIANGLRSRPSLLEAATRADRQFSGHAVMTTALECLPPARLADSQAAGIVLKQADQAAREWHPDVQRKFARPQQTANTAVLVPLFVALMLLSRPGAESLVETAVVPAPEPQQGTQIEDQYTEAELGDIAIQDVDAVAGDSDERQAEDNTQVPGDDAVIRSDNVSETPVEIDRDRLSAGTASVDGDSGDLAGDALPNTTPLADDRIRSGTIEQGQNIAIERTGPALATADANGLPYGDARLPTMSFVADALPAAPPESGPAGATLTRAQAEYAARYLNATGGSND
jgi:hypothetical protein